MLCCARAQPALRTCLSELCLSPTQLDTLSTLTCSQTHLGTLLPNILLTFSEKRHERSSNSQVQELRHSPSSSSSVIQATFMGIHAAVQNNSCTVTMSPCMNLGLRAALSICMHHKDEPSEQTARYETKYTRRQQVYPLIDK